jgi:hypothetical protein
MSEPKLNSVYLNSDPRRQDFRRARQQLLASRGSHTIIAEQIGQAYFPMNHSMPPASLASQRLYTEASFFLVDGELVYPLKLGINTIGRFLDSDVFLCERHVSRRHCVILVHTNGACELHDTASLNGTLLNGRRVAQPTLLRAGDRIRLCERDFSFRLASDVKGKRPTEVKTDGDTAF